MADDPMAFFNSLQSPPTTPGGVPIGPSGKPQPVIDTTHLNDEPKDQEARDFFNSISAPQQPTGKQYGQLETAAIHGVHGLTGGFSDELSGFAHMAGSDNPNSLVPSFLRIPYGLGRLAYGAVTGDDTAWNEYKQARDAQRQVLEQSAAQHPVTSTVSDVAGSMVLPGGEALRGASLASRLGRGAAVAGAQGAFRGAGEAQEMSDVPRSSLEGGAMSAMIGAPANAIFGPRVGSAALQEVKDIANKYGVQLPTYMVSESPLIQSYGRILDQLPLVGSALGKAGEKAREGVQNIRDAQVAGPTGSILPTEARKVASQSAAQAVNDYDAARRAVSNQNYDAVTRAMNNPNYRQTPNNLLSEAADQLAKLQTYGGDMGSTLRKAIEALRVRGGLTYDGLKNLRTGLYNNWKSMAGRSDTDRADYIGLISAITKDMEDVVNAAGGQRAVSLWKSANAQHSIGKDISQTLQSAIGKGTGETSPADTVFRNISSTRPNVGAVNELRNTMKPQEWEQMQAATIGRMGADDAGNFSIDKFITADKKLSDAGRNAMFGVSGPKREAYDAILKLGKAIQAVDQFKNTSKTATAGAALGAAYEIYHDFKEGNYSNTVGGIGAGAVVAALLARPATARNASRFAQMLDKYITSPAAKTAAQAPRALETAARNFAIEMDNSKQDSGKYINHFVGPTPLWMQ